MKVLVTGSSGRVGATLVPQAVQAGHDVVTFDLADGQDVLDLPQLASAAQGCDAIIHLAALMESPEDDPDSLMEVNVGGTANVLAVAGSHGVRRIVYMSSAAVLGVFQGHRPPDYLPLDESHPCHPSTPYEYSKQEGEARCRQFATSGLGSVVCLRPPGVWSHDTYLAVQQGRALDPEFEWSPYWEYGAFIDVRDLARASLAALHARVEGVAMLLVASSDISSGGASSRELAKQLHPDVEWRGGSIFEDEPFRGLVDVEPARQVLGWEPRYTWRVFLEAGGESES